VLTLGGVLLVNGLSAVLGTFVGWIVRDQPVALVLTLSWIIVVEPSALAVLPGARRFLPGAAEAVLVGDTDPRLPGATWSLAVLVLWLLTTGFAARALLARRDIA